MKILLSLIILVAGLCMTCAESLATKAFITDTFRISLRRGPSIENKILKFLPSGQPVEVLESKDGWSRVQPVEDEETDLEGWVLSRYLITRLPWETQSEDLKIANARLTEELADAKTGLEATSRNEKALSAEVQRYVNELDKASADYLKLKKGANDYLDLKLAYESTRQKMETLENENERLKSSQTNRWFATGGLVLLCGLIMGLIFGRQEKKRKGYY